MRPRSVAWVAALGCAASLASAQAVLAPMAAAPEQNKLALAAGSVGVKSCLPAISRLSALLVQGSRSHDVLIDWGRQRPDGEPFFSMVGLEYVNAAAAASLTAVPASGGACTVAAERISVAPYTCASVAQQELRGYTVTRLLPVYAVYVDEKEPTSSVSLIDSPPGCLIIRRYVEYGWKQQTEHRQPR